MKLKDKVIIWSIIYVIIATWWIGIYGLIGSILGLGCAKINWILAKELHRQNKKNQTGTTAVILGLFLTIVGTILFGIYYLIKKK